MQVASRLSSSCSPPVDRNPASYFFFQKATAVVVIIDLLLQGTVGINAMRLIECSNTPPPPPPRVFSQGYSTCAMLFVMPMVKALAWSQNSTLKDPKLMSMSPALKVIFPHGRVETLKHKYKKVKKSNYTFT